MFFDGHFQPGLRRKGESCPMWLIPQRAPHNRDEISPFSDRCASAKTSCAYLTHLFAMDRSDGFLVDLYVGESLQVVYVRGRRKKTVNLINLSG